jgi:hypothetical protein
VDVEATVGFGDDDGNGSSVCSVEDDSFFRFFFFSLFEELASAGCPCSSPGSRFRFFFFSGCSASARDGTMS